MNVYTTKRCVIPPNVQIVIECQITDTSEQFENFSGIVIPNETLERSLDLAITSSLSTVSNNNILHISALNITDHNTVLLKSTEVAKFSFLTPEQAENLQQIDPELIALAQMRSDTKDITEVNQLIQDFTKQGQQQSTRPAPEYDKLWFPTPETCPDPTNLPPLQKEIYEQILRFQKIERQNPSEMNTTEESFLIDFPGKIQNYHKMKGNKLKVSYSSFKAFSRNIVSTWATIRNSKSN